uniref:(northern house mosquito) hypothetical protein n=1 Tax=Culex pipiens TaxID=7175 RepID=A0A8D8FXY1_CULPI
MFSNGECLRRRENNVWRRRMNHELAQLYGKPSIRMVAKADRARRLNQTSSYSELERSSSPGLSSVAAYLETALSQFNAHSFRSLGCHSKGYVLKECCVLFRE